MISKQERIRVTRRMIERHLSRAARSLRIVRTKVDELEGQLKRLRESCTHPARKHPGLKHQSETCWTCPDCGAFYGTPVDAALMVVEELEDGKTENTV